MKTPHQVSGKMAEKILLATIEFGVFGSELAWFCIDPDGRVKIERVERKFDPSVTLPVLLFAWNGSDHEPGFHVLN